MITLRLATPEDSAALLDIYRPYVEQTAITFETEVPSQAEFRRRILEFSAEYPYILAQRGGQALGYAYAHAFHQRAAYGWTVETSVYVRMDARRSHIGKALYGALLSLLKAQGVQNACAVVTFPNEPSLAFHRAMGFETGGILPDFGYKLGVWHSVAYLYCPLGSHTAAPQPVVPLHQLDPDRVSRLLDAAIS